MLHPTSGFHFKETAQEVCTNMIHHNMHTAEIIPGVILPSPVINLTNCRAHGCISSKRKPYKKKLWASRSCFNKIPLLWGRKMQPHSSQLNIWGGFIDVVLVWVGFSCMGFTFTFPKTVQKEWGHCNVQNLWMLEESLQTSYTLSF